MIINLQTPQTVVTTPEKTKTFSTITVDRVVDLPSKKKVKCFVKELKDPVLLWEGDAYDAIGQWTDSDVQTKLTELYS
jgi:hypothetical protein